MRQSKTLRNQFLEIQAKSYTSYLENILGTEMCIKFESEEILTTRNDCIKSDSKDNEVRSFALPADEAIYFDCQQG